MRNYNTSKKFVRVTKINSLAFIIALLLGGISLPLLANSTPVYQGKDYNFSHFRQKPEVLLEAIKTGAPQDRIIAIMSCGVAKQLFCFRTIAETLFDKNDKIRYESAIALGHMRLKNSVNYLEKALAGEKTIEAKAAMIWALGMSRDKQKFDLITPHLKDENYKIRRSAAKALRLLEAGDAVTALEEAAKAEANYKVEFNEAQKELRSEMQLSDLTQAVHDTVTYEIYHALALIKPHDANFIGGLLKMLESHDNWVRFNTAQAIKELNIKEAYIPIQKALLIEDEPFVREAMASAYHYIMY